MGGGSCSSYEECEERAPLVPDWVSSKSLNATYELDGIRKGVYLIGIRSKENALRS